MLQKAIDNADDFNVFTKSYLIGDNAANAPDDEADFHPGIAGLIQTGNHTWVLYAVEFDRNARRFPGLGVFDFFFDQAVNVPPHLKLPHQQMFEGLFGAFAKFQKIKYRRYFFGDAPIGRHKSKIAVNARGAFVEIPRSQIGIATRPTADEQNFGVDLQVGQAVFDLGAPCFQLLGPFEVGLFIKTGFDLHKDHHIFALFNGRAQGGNDAGVFGHAVLSNLDVGDFGIVGGLLQQPDDVFVFLIGKMKQQILFVHHRKEAVLPCQLRMAQGRQFGIF